MQANSSGTGVGRLAEGSHAGTWEGERVPCPLLCRATGVDVSLMLTVLVPEASVASGLEEPVVDPECVSGPGGPWGPGCDQQLLLPRSCLSCRPTALVQSPEASQAPGPHSRRRSPGCTHVSLPGRPSLSQVS